MPLPTKIALADVRRELAEAKALSPTEFAAFKGLRADEVRGYVAQLEESEAFLASRVKEADSVNR